ncbi:hypothetical protein [Nonomuraea dietziae]|uniref:hypothetical protein n=1 Tax=Nonomuraea dietziae TaxID=65515 RepID=UPI0031DFDACD
MHRERYLHWLREAGRTRTVSPTSPHRREDPVDLALIRERPGVTVHAAGVPAELTPARLVAGQRVLSLPSTAISSLRSAVLSAARGRRRARARAVRLVDQRAAPSLTFAPADVLGAPS